MKYNYTQPANELQRFANMVEFPDAEPTENSAQLVTSGGVYDAIQAVEEEAKQLSYNSLMEDTASGSIASFPDGAEGVPVAELSVEIEAQQDLHGQASPYPPAGNKNILPVGNLATLQAMNTSGTWSGNAYAFGGVTFTCAFGADGLLQTITANGKATADGCFIYFINNYTPATGSYIFSGCPSGGSNSTFNLRIGKNSSYYANETGAGVSLSGDGGVYDARINIANGYTASNLTFKPMLCLSTATDPDYAHFVPYSNICPISGYTGAEITRTGKNLAYKVISNSLTSDGTTATVLSSAGTMVLFPVKAGVEYAVNYLEGANRFLIAVFDSEPTVGSTTTEIFNATPFTPTKDGIAAYYAANSVIDSGEAMAYVYGGSAEPYEPYNGTVYSIDWTDEAGTVYKGTLNVTTGELTITHGVVNLDGSNDETWGIGGQNYKYFRYDNVVGKPVTSGTIVADILSNEFKPVAFDATYSNGAVGVSVNTNGKIYVYISAEIDTDVEFRAWLAANPLQVVYPLAEPQTIQLTPTEVQTLLGDNNIWSNTGDISVKYRANTALYIEKKLG